MFRILHVFSQFLNLTFIFSHPRFPIPQVKIQALWIPEAKLSGIPESGIPYTGQISCLRESLPKTGRLRFGSENQFLKILPMNLSWFKSNWNLIKFWKIIPNNFFSGGKSLQRPTAKFLQWQRVKIAHIAKFTTSKSFYFHRLFSLPRIKMVLKRCKAHNFGPSKATHI